MRPISSDFDDNPERWQTNVRVRRQYGEGDTHPEVARRFADEGLHPALDVGCGDGELARQLPKGWLWVGADRSATMLARASRPSVLGDASPLPFAGQSFQAVALLWMLYHLQDPGLALAEARRVLRPGGLVAACTTARDDSPEFAPWVPIRPSTFDAEEALDIVSRHFEEVEVVRWDAALVHLPDRAAVRDYLVGRLVPLHEADAAAAAVEVPLDVTKRGVIVFARRLEP